jgi:tetratricopeptide (TPR) repeat protein
VPRALLVAVAAQAESEVLTACDAACRARLLEEVGANGYRFAHDAIREVVEADLGAARQAVLHRRVAEALEHQVGEPPVELVAYHYAKSDAQEKALSYLEQAGKRAAAQAAYAAAEGYYREAIARLDALGRDPDSARLREKLGYMLDSRGRYSAALELLEQAVVALHRAGDLEGLGRVVAAIGHVHANKGTPAEGIARLRPQLEALAAAGPSTSLAWLYRALASLYTHCGQFPAALAAATRSAEVARAVGGALELCNAAYGRGAVLMQMGRDEEAQPELEEASVQAEAKGNLEIAGFAAHALALIAEDRGGFDLGRRYADRVLTLGEQLGYPVLVRRALFRLAALAFFSGDWREARAYIERVEGLPDRSPVEDAAAPLALGRLFMAEGDWEQATGYLEECSAAVRPVGQHRLYRVAASLLAERDLLEGRPGAALARLLPLLDRDGMEERLVTTTVLPALAWAYLELDDIEQAARAIAEALRRERTGQYRLALVGALRVQALIVLRQGEVATATHALEEGLSLARAMPYPHGEGRLLEVYGRLHTKQGEPNSARERLEAALAIFRRLGARKDGERTEQLLSILPLS